MPHPAGSGDQRNTIWGKVELGGVLKKELVGHLRFRRRMRHAQSASKTCQSRFTLFVKVQGKDTTSVVTARARRCDNYQQHCPGHKPGIEEWNWPSTND